MAVSNGTPLFPIAWVGEKFPVTAFESYDPHEHEFRRRFSIVVAKHSSPIFAPPASRISKITAD
jgi:hypothetical protein